MLSARYFSIALLFLASLALGAVTIVTYVRESGREMRDPLQTESEARETVTAKELQALFQGTKAQGSRYAVISDRNLFSPEREAWEPPPPPKDPVEEKEPPKPAEPVNPNDVHLHGTSIVDNAAGLAVLDFNRFLSPNKRRVVEEGEVVRDDGARGENFYYRIKSIEPTKVVIEDPQQRSFDVELFASRAKVGGNFAISAMSDPEKEKLVEQGELEKISTPFGPSYRKPRGGEIPEKQLKQYREKYPEKEKLVEQGRMERIITPFGPAYRKKKQP
jgi:hypothetical protein